MFFLVSVLLTICVCFFVTRHFISLYILFEFTIVPTLFLILLFGYQPEKLAASQYLLLYMVLSSLPLLVVVYFSSKYLSILQFEGSPIWLFRLSLAFIVKTPLYLAHV